MGQVLQRIIHPGGRVEERLVQATPVPGQPGQMVIHTPSGQQIIQTQPAPASAASQGQIIRNNQQVSPASPDFAQPKSPILQDLLKSKGENCEQIQSQILVGFITAHFYSGTLVLTWL